MCGFRSPQEIRELFVEHLPRFYDRFLRGILEGQEIAESAVYAALLKLVLQSERGNRQEMLVLLEQELSGVQGDSLELKLVRRFFSQYPGDLSVLAPLYLNVLTLQPGEALYQPAGELHAYVEGIGVELMASSDNVLRGGSRPSISMHRSFSASSGSNTVTNRRPWLSGMIWDDGSILHRRGSSSSAGSTAAGMRCTTGPGSN